MDGWNVQTLKFSGWKAEGDKLQDGWASLRVVDVEIPNFVVFFCIWLFLFGCRLYVFDVLLFMGVMLLI